MAEKKTNSPIEKKPNTTVAATNNSIFTKDNYLWMLIGIIVIAIGMFLMSAINVPLLGIVENMSYFTPAELPENKYYIFGQGGGQKLAGQLEVPFLGEIPLVKGISDSGDAGKPVILDEQSPMSKAFTEMAQKVAQQVAIYNAEANNRNLVNN